MHFNLFGISQSERCGLEWDLEDHVAATPLPWGVRLSLNQTAQSPTQPVLEHLQGCGNHNRSEQPVLASASPPSQYIICS